MIGDFGVPIAIFFMIAVDISISDAYTQVWQTLIIWRSLLLQVFSVKGSNSNYAIQASKRNGIIFIYLFCVIVWAVLVKIFQCFFTVAVNLVNVCYIQIEFLFYIFVDIYCENPVLQCTVKDYAHLNIQYTVHFFVLHLNQGSILACPFLNIRVKYSSKKKK